jgi:hypothetical protein
MSWKVSDNSDRNVSNIPMDRFLDVGYMLLPFSRSILMIAAATCFTIRGIMHLALEETPEHSYFN